MNQSRAVRFQLLPQLHNVYFERIGKAVVMFLPHVLIQPRPREDFLRMPQEADEAYSKNVPVGRLGRPGDIAAVAAFLASAASGYMTGSCIDVNGGIRMQ